MNSNLFKKLISVYVVFLFAIVFLVHGIIGKAADLPDYTDSESYKNCTTTYGTWYYTKASGKSDSDMATITVKSLDGSSFTNFSSLTTDFTFPLFYEISFSSVTLPEGTVLKFDLSAFGDMDETNFGIYLENNGSLEPYSNSNVICFDDTTISSLPALYLLGEKDLGNSAFSTLNSISNASSAMSTAITSSNFYRSTKMLSLKINTVVGETTQLTTEHTITVPMSSALSTELGYSSSGTYYCYYLNGSSLTDVYSGSTKYLSTISSTSISIVTNHDGEFIITDHAISTGGADFSDSNAIEGTTSGSNIIFSDSNLTWTFPAESAPNKFNPGATFKSISPATFVATYTSYVVPSTAKIVTVDFSTADTSLPTGTTVAITIPTTHGFSTESSASFYAYKINSDKTLTLLKAYTNASKAFTLTSTSNIIISDTAMTTDLTAASTSTYNYISSGLFSLVPAGSTTGTEVWSVGKSTFDVFVAPKADTTTAWSFSKSNITSTVAFNPVVTITNSLTTDQTTAASTAGFASSTVYSVVTTGQTTDIPGTATCSVGKTKLTSLTSASNIYAYYYDSSTKVMSYVGEATIGTSSVSFTVTQPGTYVLASAKADAGYTLDSSAGTLTYITDGTVPSTIWTTASSLGYKVIIKTTDSSFIWTFPKSSSITDFDPTGTVTSVSPLDLYSVYTSYYFAADMVIKDIKFDYSGDLPTGTILTMDFVNTTNYPNMATIPPQGYYVDSTNKKLTNFAFYQTGIGISITKAAETYLISNSVSSQLTGSYYYSSDGKTLTQKVSNTGTTGTDIWTYAMSKGLNVQITNETSTIVWYFEAANIKKAVDFCPYYKRGTSTTNGFEDAVKNYGFPSGTIYMGLLFSHTGELPGKASVTFKFDGTESWTDGITLYYYYYNPTDKTLTLIDTPKYSSHSCTVPMEHCCEYLLSSTKYGTTSASASSSSSSGTGSSSSTTSPKTDNTFGNGFRDNTDFIANFFRWVKEWLAKLQ